MKLEAIKMIRLIMDIDNQDNLLDTMDKIFHKLKGGLRTKGLFNKKSKTDKPPACHF